MLATRYAQVLQHIGRSYHARCGYRPAWKYRFSHSVSIYGFTFSDVWIQEANGDKNLVMIFVIIADVLVIVTACLGIYGIKKAKPFFLFLFTILVGLFCLVLITGGVLAAKAPDTMLNDTLCTDGNSTITPDNQWFADILLLEAGSFLFCTPNCPCALSNLENYTFVERAVIETVYTGRNGTAVQLQGCKTFENAVSVLGSGKILSYMTALGSIEDYFGCTGWCGPMYQTDYLFYKFSNIKNGRPSSYCYWSLKDWVLKWAHVMEYTCFAVAGALFIVFIFNMCICCHPERRAKRMTERFYDPAVNTDYARYN